MGRMNIYLDNKEDEKLKKLSDKYKIKSKEDVIKRLINWFPLNDKEFEVNFDIDKETGFEDLI